MERLELHHPVTEESAREFVDKSAPSDTSDQEKDQRVTTLLESAAHNRAWRDSRDPVERLRLDREPFAVHDPEDDTPDEDEEGDDTNADA